MRKFLERHGKKLSETGKSTDSYYYEMRDKFNENQDPLFFLFLNRSCYNGLIRFNNKGEFNTPFGRKPNRFSKSLITKICNQIDWVSGVIKSRKFLFKCCGWKEIIEDVGNNDFVYIDPPYYGRHDTYFNDWSERKAIELANWTNKSECGYAISMWLENKHRKNEFITKYWSENEIRTYNHYYFVGSKEKNRRKIVEALIIRPGYSSDIIFDIKQPFENYKD